MEIDQMWEGERAKFEAEIVKMNDDPAMLERWPGGAYKHHGVDGRWSGWKMACRASRPAEVDDEGDIWSMIPDGYALVPIEPTYEMAKAGGFAWESNPGFPWKYRAMLAVATSPITNKEK